MKLAKIVVMAFFFVLLIAPANARIHRNRAPIANAGSPQTVTVGTLVHLDGSGSYDPDGQTITYSWIIQARPAGSTATLSSQTSVQPTFTPDVAGSYGIRLVVKDSRGLSSSPSTVTITATPALLPIANAGANQTVTVGSIVTLNGSSSSDPYGQPLTYQWSIQSKPTGSTAALTSPTTVQTSFTPDVAGNYMVSLVVRDSSGLSSTPSSVTVTANTPIGVQTNCYGTYWRWAADGLGNVQVGSDNYYDKVTYRIRAQNTGQVDSVRCYWMVATGKTYSSGDGGIIRCELQTDDGTANHLPSGNVLASFQITVNAVQGANTANSLFGTLHNGCSFNRLYFNSPATLQVGQLYHIVFTNPASDPVNNYWSVDCIFNRNPISPMQPAYPNSDLATLIHHSSGSWSNPAANYTPIYTLYCTDGTVQGQPYMQLGYPLGIAGYPVYGSTCKVRQQFKVSGASKTVTAVNVSLYKVGSPPDLTVKLQNSGGNTIAQGTVSASTFVANNYDPRWGKVTFSSPITLNVGSTYYVEVSASGGDSSNCYYTWSTKNGYDYGFAGDGFVDGSNSGNYGYYMTDGSNWKTNYDDMIISSKC
jgi:hypothetical protein